MTYIRYVLNKVADPGTPGNPSTPVEQAGYNDGFASNSEFFNQDDAYQIEWGSSGYTGSPDSKHTKFARSMQAKLSGQFDPEHASQFD